MSAGRLGYRIGFEEFRYGLRSFAHARSGATRVLAGRAAKFELFSALEASFAGKTMSSHNQGFLAIA